MSDLPDSVTGDNEHPQIVAPDSPLPDQLWAALRQVAPPIATFALGKGWISNDALILLTAVAGVLWPIVQGQLAVRHRVTQLINVGNNPRVPDSVVTTAGKV